MPGWFQRWFFAPMRAEEADVDGHLVRSFIAHIPLNAWASIGVALCVFGSISGYVSTIGLLLWTGGLIGFSTLLLVRARRRRGRCLSAASMATVRRNAWLWCLASGITWGAAALFMPALDHERQLLLMLVVVAAAAAGTVTLASQPAAARVFVFAALSPYLVYFLWSGGAIKGWLVAMTAVLLATLQAAVQSVYQTHIAAITAHRAAIAAREIGDQLSNAKDVAEAASQAKTAFLANMSHELRTPLNAIIGYSELILDDRDDAIEAAKRQEYTRYIHEAGRHLLSIVNDILDHARVEAGKTQLVEERVDLGEVLRNVVTIVQPRATAAGVTVAIAGFRPLPLLWADGRLLTQVFLNLVGNAVKFSRQGGTVRIMVDRDGGGCRVTIADQGIGIAPDRVTRVFEPFAQADAMIARSHGGTGLGLPLAKRLIELHDGALELISQLGEGTRVMVRLPAERVLEPAGAAAAYI